MITLDALVVNVALPVVGRDLGGGITGLQWVVDGYTLMFAARLLSAGALCDRIGAPGVRAGLAVFVAASAACGLAPGLGVLVAARLVQGAGAAVTMPALLALIRQAYPTRSGEHEPSRVGDGRRGGVGCRAGGRRCQHPAELADDLLHQPARGRRGAAPARPHRPLATPSGGQVAADLGMGALTYGAIEAGAEGFTAPPRCGRRWR